MNKWISNNNIAKVIALCISIILWAMVHLDSATPVSTVNQPLSTRTIENVKIQVYNFDSDKYVLYGLNPDRVTLEVSGKASRLTSLFSDDNYKVKLDLDNLGPGTRTVPLKCELPNGVECVSITPSSVQVTIEAKESKEFEADIVTEGEPAKGYELGTPVVSGNGKVKVTLPSSEIGEVQKVQGTVNVEGLDSDITGRSVKLIAYDKAGEEMKDAQISPSSINVDVPLIKLYKSVPVELKTTGTLPPGYALSEISSSVEQVVVYGSKEVLDGISNYPVTVDLGKFKGPGDTAYTVDLTPPDGFERIEPGSLQVTIKATPFEKKTLNDIPVTLLGAGAGYTAKVISPESGRITATVEGSAERISAIKSDELSFTADLSGYGEGTFTVTLTPRFPQYIYLADPGNKPTAQVEITAQDKPATVNPDPSGESGDPSSSSGSGTSENGETGGETSHPPEHTNSP
ncbi:YbbR-like domain-containing protein [Paenibacillus caui]|uniref:CdaR family protein n=1 Tax=Paenibacillus caui TaxID=2873927 RepID=UPI001CA7B8CD|nr:CdaR family protein [Paenibacillus caui]